jgi:hypothetical protein
MFQHVIVFHILVAMCCLSWIPFVTTVLLHCLWDEEKEGLLLCIEEV